MIIPSIKDFVKEGLSFKEAVMAREAMASSIIEGAIPISAERMVELIKEEKDG